MKRIVHDLLLLSFFMAQCDDRFRDAVQISNSRYGAIKPKCQMLCFVWVSELQTTEGV